MKVGRPVIASLERLVKERLSPRLMLRVTDSCFELPRDPPRRSRTPRTSGADPAGSSLCPAQYELTERCGT